MKHDIICPFPVYSSEQLNEPALGNPVDGHVAYARDYHGRVVRVVWSKATGSYVNPVFLLRLPTAA